MAAIVGLGNILQARFCCLLGDQVAFNVRHYRCTASAGSPTDQQIANALDNQAGQVYPDVISGPAEYRGTDVQIIGGGGGTTVPVFSTTGHGMGNVGTNPLPRQVAGLISLRTALAGRAFRGRVYTPFPDESDNDVNGHPSAACQTRLGNLRDFLVLLQIVTNGVDSATIDPVILHAGTGSTSSITVGLIRPQWATQRRRGDFGRKNLAPF